MDPILAASLVWLIITMSFAALWTMSREKLKTALKQVEEKQRIAEDARTKHARVIDDADIKRAALESRHLRLLQDVEERLAAVREKYSGIISPEEEVERLKQEASNIATQIDDTRMIYAEKRKMLDRLQEQVAVYDERLAFAELGVYEPHFNFGDSEDFKIRILEVRERQKNMISAKSAALCPAEWSVEGSKSKGQTMINRQTRLTLRAFNNECDAAIANARWNNVVAMEKRILYAEQAINKGLLVKSGGYPSSN